SILGGRQARTSSYYTRRGENSNVLKMCQSWPRRGFEAGNPQAVAQLLPLVYDELRQLATKKLVPEKPGQTLDATAWFMKRICGWSAPATRRAMRIASTSTAPRPRRCVASSLTTPAKRKAGNTAASGS